MKLNRIFNPGSLIMLILAIWMLYKNLQLRQQQSLLNNYNISLIQDSTAFSREVSKLGDTLAIQSEMLLSESQAKKILSEELAYLKKVKSNVKIITKTEIKEVQIPALSEPIYIENDLDSFMKIPQSYKDSTDYFSLHATLNKSGLKINSLSIQNRSSITLGLQKRGFFKSSEPVVTVTHSNPLIKTIGMNNVTIDTSKPFYETRTFNIAVGALIGYGIAK